MKLSKPAIASSILSSAMNQAASRPLYPVQQQAYTNIELSMIYSLAGY